MKINKVLVLGIDALDYELVKEWKLKNLQQAECGKLELPIYPGEEPNTRIIWPCFITGKMPNKMGYVTGNVFKPPLQFFVNKFSPRVKSLLNPQSDEPSDILKRKASNKIQFSNQLYRRLKKLDLVKKPSREDIKASTIFENVEKSIHSHIPIYDEYLPSYSDKVVKAIENKTYRQIFEMHCTREFNLRSNEVFDWWKRKKEWDLYMNYFWCLDGIQHAFFNNIKRIAKFYIMFDEFVGKLRKVLDDDTLLLIVSDHGQKKGIHTNYGFYSVNKPLGLKHPRLIEFKQIVEELLEDGHT